MTPFCVVSFILPPVDCCVNERIWPSTVDSCYLSHFTVIEALIAGNKNVPYISVIFFYKDSECKTNDEARPWTLNDQSYSNILDTRVNK